MNAPFSLSRGSTRDPFTRALRNLIVAKAVLVSGGFLHIPMGVPRPAGPKYIPPPTVRDDRAR